MKKRTLLIACLSIFIGLSPIKGQNVLTVKDFNKTSMQDYKVTVPENMQLITVGKTNILTCKDVRTANSEAQDVTFTFKGIIPKGYTVSQGCLYNKDGKKNLYFATGTTEMSEKMPAGKYDAFLCFRDANQTLHYVIKENLTIEEGTVVEFDALEADQSLTFKYYDENNAELFCDRYQGSNLVEKGSVDILTNNVCITSKDYGNLTIIMSQGFFPVDHPELVFLNKPSDRYYIASGTLAVKPDNTRYVFKKVIRDFSTQTIVNDSKELAFKQVTIENTPAAKDDMNSHFPVQSFICYNNHAMVVQSERAKTKSLDEEFKTFKLWLDSPMSDENDDIQFEVLYTPKYNDMIMENSHGRKVNYAVTSPGYNGNKSTGVRLYHNGTDQFGAFNKTPDFKRGKMTPCNPYLSFEPNEKVVMGNSAPICSFAAFYTKEGNSISGSMRANYLGKYGEFYEASKELVKSAATQENIDGGLFQLTIPNYNVEVDGIEGENITRVVFDPNKEDFLAPTFHFLTVLDEKGEINDHLETVNGAKIVLTGADYDYTYNSEQWFGYFTYKETAVAEVYYSFNGYEDDWKKLDVNVIPEKLFEPVYGNYYEVSLDGVEITEPDTWLDLKLVITDESGNYQEQIIRPVINVQNTSTGVKQVRKEGLDILVFDNTIRLTAGNKAQINIYAVDGTNVMSANGSEINIENLTPGVYVVNATCGSTSINKKFIKN